MWHVGPYLVYPDILFYIVYMPLAVGFVIFGALRQNKFEWAGWALLALLIVGMILGG